MSKLDFEMGDSAGQLNKYKVGEACIIHSMEDYATANYFKEFFKWTGLSFFDFVYHENNEELNLILQDGSNHFDFIIYIHDKEDRWKQKYGKLTSLNVDIPDDFDLQEVITNHNIPESLGDIWIRMFSRCVEGTDYATVFAALFKIYVECNIFHKLINNNYLLSVDYIDGYEVKLLLEELNEEKKQWKVTVEKLTEFRENYSIRLGMEHVLYALVYSQRKISEISGMLREKMPYSTQKMLETLNSIYKINPYFYMAESLKAKVVAMNIEDLVFSATFMKNCTELCPSDACNSFHYYRLGKLFEKFNRPQMAKTAYEISYKKNPLNFRALFKIIVSDINFRNYVTAHTHIFQLLQILQVENMEDMNYERRLKLLPPIELEYVCKCYILLARVKQLQNTDIKDLFQKVQAVADSVEENEYLYNIYMNKTGKMKQRLRGRLSETVIQKKSRNIGKLDE